MMNLPNKGINSVAISIRIKDVSGKTKLFARQYFLRKIGESGHPEKGGMEKSPANINSTGQPGLSIIFMHNTIVAANLLWDE